MSEYGWFSHLCFAAEPNHKFWKINEVYVPFLHVTFLKFFFIDLTYAVGGLLVQQLVV
jgi:hypothetical protein